MVGRASSAKDMGSRNARKKNFPRDPSRTPTHKPSSRGFQRLLILNILLICVYSSTKVRDKQGIEHETGSLGPESRTFAQTGGGLFMTSWRIFAINNRSVKC